MLAIVSFCFLPRALEYFHEKAIHQTPHGLMEFLTFETPDQDTYACGASMKALAACLHFEAARDFMIFPSTLRLQPQQVDYT